MRLATVFRQESDAADIEGVANEALNTSTEALRLVNEALTVPDDTARVIDGIEQEYVTCLCTIEITHRRDAVRAGATYDVTFCCAVVWRRWRRCTIRRDA